MAAVNKGRGLPEWFLEEPPSVPGQDFYFKAFWFLSTTRQLGMGLGPLPSDKALEYAVRSGLDGDMADAFVRIMAVMDTSYLEWQDKEAERKRRHRGDGEAGGQ